MTTTVGALRAAVLVVACVLGCKGRDDTSRHADAPTETARAVKEPVAQQVPTGYSLLSEVQNCDLVHQGIVLDLGTDAADSRRQFSAGPFKDVANETRGGKTFAKVFTRELSYRFWLQRSATGLAVGLRGVAGFADRVNVYLDDERLQNLKLPRDEPGFLVSAPSTHEFAPGLHSVTLRFVSRKAAADVPYAELDWLWIGDPNQLTPQYAAPTFEDVVADVALRGEPRRSLVLRTPSTVRCPLQAVRGTHFEVAAGYWGLGSGTVQVRALVDGEPPVVLSEQAVTGGDDASWQQLSLDLSRFEGKVVAVELIASESQGGGRIAFGEPRVSIKNVPAATPLPSAETVVLVVAGGLDRKAIPPWGSAHGMRGISELARQGVTFNGYRVKSTVTNAVFASLLTGLPPRSHTVEDVSARLPKASFTIAEMLKEKSGRTALFSAVPFSFKSFGFDEGWDRYVAYSPVEDVAAASVFSDAAAWLKERSDGPERKRLVVIHSRGGHPPWDLTKTEVAELPPEEYGGVLDARRGAIILAQMRNAGPAGQRRLHGEDWTRLRAMQAAALRSQDQAIASLVDVLEQAGQWDNTMFIFMGDVAMGEPPNIPFGTTALSEDRLLVPLIVKFPGSAFRGQQSNALCTSEDVTRTILEALNLGSQPNSSAENLGKVLNGIGTSQTRPAVALQGNQFSTRWGPWLLLGEFGRAPRLCNLEVDPACATDVFAINPISSSALWRHTFEMNRTLLANKSRPWRREPADIDAQTAAALSVWGE